METEKIAESVAKTADLLDLNEKTVRAGIERGEIPKLRIGRRVLVPMWWIRQQLTGAGKAA